jgi:hypothetical protein
MEGEDDRRSLFDRSAEDEEYGPAPSSDGQTAGTRPFSAFSCPSCISSAVRMYCRTVTRCLGRHVRTLAGALVISLMLIVVFITLYATGSLHSSHSDFERRRTDAPEWIGGSQRQRKPGERPTPSPAARELRTSRNAVIGVTLAVLATKGPVLEVDRLHLPSLSSP